MYFFPKFAALNLTWSEKPKKVIRSHITGSRGILTKPDMANFKGNHAHEYKQMIERLKA
ncbi:hypothetical protein VPBB_1681 [Vibrio parahaemolyticus BB22OP]|nr:hypothetical protein VPBB_1681 [Vibrio parahaemolyticus BB22OP]